MDSCVKQKSLIYKKFAASSQIRKIEDANFISIVKQKPVKPRECHPKKKHINAKFISSLLRVAQEKSVKRLDERTDSGNDTLGGNSSNEDSNGVVSKKITYENVADVAKAGTLNECIRRKYGWKQLRLQIIVIRKFKEALPRSNDNQCSSITYGKNIYPNSKFDEFSVNLSKDPCPTGIKEDMKSIREDATADTSIKSELSFNPLFRLSKSIVFLNK